jgi:hypothetical protein
MLKKDLIRYNEILMKQNSDLIKLVQNNFHIMVEVEDDVRSHVVESIDLKLGLFVGENELPLPFRFNTPKTILLNGVLYKKYKDYNKEETNESK